MKRGFGFFSLMWILFCVLFMVGSDIYLSGASLDDAVAIKATIVSNAEFGESITANHSFFDYDNPNFIGDKIGVVVNKTANTIIFLGMEAADAGLYYGYKYHPDPETVGWWVLVVMVAPALIPIVFKLLVLIVVGIAFIAEWAGGRKK